MPNCCVPGCRNSTHKGYVLKCFPKNEKRRIQWIKNINRRDWTPYSAHRVCEVHFAPDMWEKMRVDGSRKLKATAVPTIFGDDVNNIPSMKAVETSAESSKTDKSVSSTQGKNSLKNITINNPTLIKILPSNTKSSILAPTVIPASNVIKFDSVKSSGTIMVKNKNMVIKSSVPVTLSGGTSILKPVVKTADIQSSPMLISTNADILKNQIKAASNQTPIIIPASNSILKPQAQAQNSPTTVTSATSSLPFKVVRSETLISASNNSIYQKINEANKIPVKSVSSVVNIKPKLSNTEKPSSQSTVNTIANKVISSNENSQETPISGIILNKTEAKKMDEERFQKMDKLLLKQLKLNDALRKKLHLMNRKMKVMMTEQNKKQSFLSDVFTKDQIRVLELKRQNSRSIVAWSNQTMMKALRLKEECGTRGYEELLKQHMPLPSLRTLTRWCMSKDIPIP